MTPFEKLIDNSDFQDFLLDLIERTGALGGAFSPDLATMSYNEGRRSVGLHLLIEWSNVSPKSFSEAVMRAAVDGEHTTS